MNMCERRLRMPRGCLKVAALIACPLVALASSAAAAAPRYNIVTLDVLPGGVDSYATGINEQGVVVGYSILDRSGNVGRARPVMWDASGQPTELWPLEGPFTPGGIPLGINSAGQVVGRYGVGSGVLSPSGGVPDGRAFIWDATNGRQDLGSLGGNRIEAVAINELGQVAGTSSHAGLPGDPFVEEPFIWDPAAGMQGLGSLGGIVGRAAAINNLGQVAGTSWLADFSERPFLWDSVNGMQNLGTLGGNFGRAFGMSDAADVVGYSQISSGFAGAFLHTGDGAIRSLTSINTPFTLALDVNNLGQIVGRGSRNSMPVAVIWDELHGSQDLATLTTTDFNWQLETVTAINDRGQIVGYGWLNDEIRGFLLTPVPEPSTKAITIVVAIVAVLSGALDCALARQFTPSQMKGGHHGLGKLVSKDSERFGLWEGNRR